MKYDTTRFGEIEVKEADLIMMPDGPLGFPDCKRWTLIDNNKAFPFRLMQSLDNPALCFVVVSPLFLEDDYKIEITKEYLALFDIEDPERLTFLCVVTMAKNFLDITVNLNGPLLIHNNVCRQIVMPDSDYTTREPLVRRKNDSN